MSARSRPASERKNSRAAVKGAARDLAADLRAADPFRQAGGKMFSRADRSRFLDVLDRMLRAAQADRPLSQAEQTRGRPAGLIGG